MIFCIFKKHHLKFFGLGSIYIWRSIEWSIIPEDEAVLYTVAQTLLFYTLLPVYLVLDSTPPLSIPIKAGKKLKIRWCSILKSSFGKSPVDWCWGEFWLEVRMRIVSGYLRVSCYTRVYTVAYYCTLKSLEGLLNTFLFTWQFLFYIVTFSILSGLFSSFFYIQLRYIWGRVYCSKALH